MSSIPLKRIAVTTSAAALLLLGSIPAKALVFSFTDSDSPNGGTNSLSNLGFTMESTSSGGAIDGDPVGGVYNTNGTKGVTFNDPLTKQTVGNPAWLTWSHSYNGEVFVNSTNTTTIDLTDSTNSGTNILTAFDFYVQPSDGNFYSISVTANGSSSPITLVQSVTGAGGAKYFGFYATDKDTFSNITISAPPEAQGFATGEFRVSTSAVTTPVPFALLPKFGAFSAGYMVWISFPQKSNSQNSQNVVISLPP
jgi:hypothetical protein